MAVKAKSSKVDRAHRRFQPRNLASYLQVNRLWHRTLTSLLWKVSVGRSATKLITPQYGIETYSRHILCAELTSEDPAPIRFSPRFRELEWDFSSSTDWTRHIDALRLQQVI
ncbi:hypothetical protein BGZ82_004977, partial [Podila clonocystis]